MWILIYIQQIYEEHFISIPFIFQRQRDISTFNKLLYKYLWPEYSQTEKVASYPESVSQTYKLQRYYSLDDLNFVFVPRDAYWLFLAPPMTQEGDLYHYQVWLWLSGKV